MVTTNFNLLPQLSPANNIVQQEIKNAKSLSEASRILEEAVENYPCDNKSTLKFLLCLPYRPVGEIAKLTGRNSWLYNVSYD